MARSNFDNKKNNIRKKQAIVALVLAIIAGSGVAGNEIHEYYNAPSTSIEQVDDTINVEEQSLGVNNQYSYMKTKEAENLYNVATNEIADLLDSMHFDNDIQYFYAFYMYLNDGLFSEVDNIRYAEGEDFIDDINALGLDCIIDKDNNGEITAVCRHKDALFSDVLEKSDMGFEAYSTTCCLENDKNLVLESTEPNHQITVVNYGNDIKYYDISNGAVADKYVSNKLCINTDDGTIYYKIFPEDTLYDHAYITKHNTIDKINRIENLVDSDSKTLSYDEIDKEYKIAYRKMNANKKLVDRFEVKYKDDVLDQLQKVK